MTNAELIARLREDVFYGEERLHNLSRHNPLHMEAADRIELLEHMNNALAGAVDQRDATIEVLEAKLAENEVRLGKAVEALEVYACGPECADGKCYDTGNSCGQFATATLAEIKSEFATQKGGSHG